MYNKKGIVIDNVGVLLDDPLANIGWLAKRYGLDGHLNEAKDYIWKSEFSVNPDMTPYHFWSKVFDRVGMALTRREIEKINEEIIDRHVPRKGILDYVRGLKENPQVVTVLWTNVNSDWISKFNDRLGMYGLFDNVAASCFEGKRKDNPDFIRNMLRKFKDYGCGFIAGIDDQEKNLKILRKAGVYPTILYTNEEQAIRDLGRCTWRTRS